MKSKCILESQEDTEKFNTQAEIIYKQLLATKDGAKILKIIADVDNSTSQQYLDEYYKQFELRFSRSQTELAQTYLSAVKTVRDYCQKHNEAVEYINEMAIIMTQSKVEISFQDKVRQRNNNSDCCLIG